MQRLRVFICAVAITAIFHITNASAAILSSIPTNTAPSSPANLTTAGALDWAIWNVTSTSTVLTLPPTNEKLSGPNFISDLTNTVNGSNLRGGAGTIPTQGFTYTNGTSPASQTNATINYAFPSTVDSLNQGMQFTVTGDPTQQRQVQIWATGFEGQGTLTASLAGASNQVLLSQSYSNTKGLTLFTITFQPDQISDLLTIKYALSSETVNGSSHVGLQAVAVSAVPEPSTLALGLSGVLGLIFMRRKYH